MRQKSMILALCLAGALLLGGCSKQEADTGHSASPSPSPSAGTGSEGDYEADDHGAVNGSGSAHDTGPVESGSPGGSTQPGGGDPDSSGDGLLSDVGDAVDDLVESAKRAARGAD